MAGAASKPLHGPPRSRCHRGLRSFRRAGGCSVGASPTACLLCSSPVSLSCRFAASVTAFCSSAYSFSGSVAWQSARSCFRNARLTARCGASTGRMVLEPSPSSGGDDELHRQESSDDFFRRIAASWIPMKPGTRARFAASRALRTIFGTSHGTAANPAPDFPLMDSTQCPSNS